MSESNHHPLERVKAEQFYGSTSSNILVSIALWVKENPDISVFGFIHSVEFENEESITVVYEPLEVA